MGNPRRFLPVEADVIVGLACTGHGASIALLTREGLVRASVFDRWDGTKNTLLLAGAEDKAIRRLEGASDVDRSIHAALTAAYGRFPRTEVFEETADAWIDWFLRGSGIERSDVDLVVTSDGYFVSSRGRLGPQLGRWFPRARIVSSPEHHEIHQRQAFWQSGFSRAAVLTLDSSGEPLRRLGGRRLCGTIGRATNDGRWETLREFLCPMSAGSLYATINHHLGFRQNEEGKTMGLAPYGRPELYERLRRLLLLLKDGGFQFPLGRPFERFLADFVPAATYPPISPTARQEDVAFAGQALLEDIVTHAFRHALELTGEDLLVYAGGVALNCVATEKARRAAGPAALYVAPNAGDTGHALGCAMLGAYELARWPSRNQEVPEYLGPRYTRADYERPLAAADMSVMEPDHPAEVLADALCGGAIVARCVGPAEFGPRALGNRSILADPRTADVKNRLNARVKHREAFRPFAPAVLAEHVEDWFDMQGTSAYMLRAVAVRAALAHRVPGVVHVDGTSRVQTVRHEDNAEFRRILEAFHARTGVPMVVNTSFNVAGKPVVETPEQAVASFASTDIDMLALGPFLLSKRSL